MKRLFLSLSLPFLLGAASCPGKPQKPPEPPPPQPQCAEGQVCGCWHRPPEAMGWLYACCAPGVPGGVVNVQDPAQCIAQPPPSSASPKIENGKWLPALRGATNCCDDDRTPAVDEGLADGWALVTDAALARIDAAGTVNWTHIRLGPFSAGPGVVSIIDARDSRIARSVQATVKSYGAGPEILPEARASILAAQARGIYVEVDVVDNWALVNSAYNYYGDTCAVTKAAPPARYLDWVKQVVDATWDLPVTYNLGNEGFRCRPEVEWENGLYNALKSQLSSHGVSRPVGNTITVEDTRVTLDYRTYHGWHVPPATWSQDIPAMLTETNNRLYSAAEWAQLVRQSEERGFYVSIWRGPNSWDEHNAAIAAMPTLGEPPPLPSNCMGEPLVPAACSEQMRQVVKNATDALTPGPDCPTNLKALAATITQQTGKCVIAGYEAVFILRDDGLAEENHTCYFGNGQWTNAGFGKFIGCHTVGASSACNNPDPIPLSRFGVKEHTKGPAWTTLDSTPNVGPDVAYCAKIGFTDGRSICPVRQEGAVDREACEAEIVGTPQWTGPGEVHPENPYLYRVARGVSGTATVCGSAVEPFVCGSVNVTP